MKSPYLDLGSLKRPWIHYSPYSKANFTDIDLQPFNCFQYFDLLRLISISLLKMKRRCFLMFFDILGSWEVGRMAMLGGEPRSAPFLGVRMMFRVSESGTVEVSRSPCRFLVTNHQGVFMIFFQCCRAVLSWNKSANNGSGKPKWETNPDHDTVFLFSGIKY